MELKEQKTGGFGIIQKNEDGTISQIGLTESQYTVFEIFLENLSPVVRLPEEFNLRNAKLETDSVDITGRRICLGDKVGYDLEDENSSFIVVFEENTFRKKYPNWFESIEKPILDYGVMAKKMRLKII